MATTTATVRRDGTALVFTGALLRDGIAALWPLATGAPGAGVDRLDLRAVERVDSAGLAFLAELADMAPGTVVIEGTPEGLAELCAAYRLAPTLDFAT